MSQSVDFRKPPVNLQNWKPSLQRVVRALYAKYDKEFYFLSSEGNQFTTLLRQDLLSYSSDYGAAGNAIGEIYPIK